MQLDDLIEQMAHLLDAPCTLEDAGFRLVGFSHQSSAVDAVRQRSILERESTDEVRAWFHAHGIRDAVDPVRTPADPERGIVARLCVPVRHLGRLQGYFWFLDPEERITDDQLREVDQLSRAAAALMGESERRQTRRDALYRELVETGPDRARPAAAELAAGAGLDTDRPVRCVVVARPDLREQLANRPSRNGVVWVREGDELSAAVVRADLVADDMTRAQLLRALGLSSREPALDRETVVGTGPEVPSTYDVARSRAGALTALRVARARGEECAAWGGLGAVALVGVARDDDLRWALHTSGIRRLLEEAPAELRRTARVYLDEAGSVARCAERLSVHRQTVYHRLAQVGRVTGLDLDDGRDRLRLHLALQVEQVLSG